MTEVLGRRAASLFSTAVFREVLAGVRSQRVRDLTEELQDALGVERDGTNREIVCRAYTVLERHYRSEYYYKNLITSKVFVGRHRAANSALLGEFRVKSSVADCVLVNGLASVFEIKTEYDSPEKLERQAADYFRAFGLVSVVTHESGAARYLELLEDSPMGLVSVGRKGRLSKVKAPEMSVASLETKAMFDALRLSEVTSILRRRLGVVPDVPNGLRYDAFLEAAEALQPLEFQREMQRELKLRRTRNRAVILDPAMRPLRSLLARLDPTALQEANLIAWLESRER